MLTDHLCLPLKPIGRGASNTPQKPGRRPELPLVEASATGEGHGQPNEGWPTLCPGIR